MKVKLAVQAIASDSVARTLEWAYENNVPGFDSPNVLATAKFEKLMDKTFDILNSRSPNAPGFKKTLTLENFAEADCVLKQVEEMFSVLEDGNGTKLINSSRITGPLGLLVDIKSIRGLINDMQQGVFNISYLATYKFSQDHLELFFNAIRTRNGWSYNPTSQQFRSAFRSLTIHAAQKITGSASANIIAQDETSILSISHSSRIETDDIQQQDMLETSPDVLVHFDGCGEIHYCITCTSGLTYIGGFIVFALNKIIKCNMCKLALLNSDKDPTLNSTLITKKNFLNERKDVKNGLVFPSGSVCRILYQAEKLFRHSIKISLSDKNLQEKLLLLCLNNLNTKSFFPSINYSHDLVTSDGVNNHSLALVHLVLLKFINIRLKKSVQASVEKVKGNHMHRMRIFANA